MRRLAFSAFFALAIVALSIGVGPRGPAVISPGPGSFSRPEQTATRQRRITLTQSGNGVVGTSAATGNGFTAKFVSDTQINGKWHGPGGAGWLTIYVSANGHSFNGTWGYNGRPANGSFVGKQSTAAVADHRRRNVDT